MKVVDRALALAAQRGWRQSQFARMLGLADSRFSKWKAGEGEPNATQVRDIARVLRVSADVILAEGDLPAIGEEKDGPLSVADQHAILLTVKSLGLTAEATIKLLHAGAPEPPDRSPQVLRPAGVQTFETEYAPVKKPTGAKG